LKPGDINHLQWHDSQPRLILGYDVAQRYGYSSVREKRCTYITTDEQSMNQLPSD